jgi:hypothetical protein
VPTTSRTGSLAARSSSTTTRLVATPVTSGSEIRVKTCTKPIGSAAVRSVGSTIRVAILPDIHAPYHHKEAWALTVQALRAWAPDTVIQLGDLIDLACVSSYVKDPRTTLSLAEEVRVAREVVADIASIVDAPRSGKKLVMCAGNHSARLSKYILQNAPELIGCVSVPELLGFDRYGAISVPYGEGYEMGDCIFTHDIGRCGANVARQQLLDAGCNIVAGHSHRLQIVYGGSVYGARHVSASLGWLGDPQAIDYRHRSMVKREWTLAFGTAIFLADGNFFLRQHPIVNGRCEVDGVVYGARTGKKRARKT